MSSSHSQSFQYLFAIFFFNTLIFLFCFFSLGPWQYLNPGLSYIFGNSNSPLLKARTSISTATTATGQLGLVWLVWRWIQVLVAAVDLEFFRSVPWQFWDPAGRLGSIPQFWDESAHSWGYSPSLIVSFSAYIQWKSGQPLEKSNNISVWIWGLVLKVNFVTANKCWIRAYLLWCVRLPRWPL